MLAAPSAAQDLDLERVTTGPSGGNVDTYTELWDSSADGTRAIFSTFEDLTPDDNQPFLGFYERRGDVTRLLTRATGTGPSMHMWFLHRARVRPGRHRITLRAGSGPPIRLVVRLLAP